MIKRLLLSLAAVLCFAGYSHAQCVKYNGVAGQSGKVVVAGFTSTTNVFKTFPASTVDIYTTGTTTHTSIFSDSSCSVVKANPTTAASDATFSFYAVAQRVDLRFSGTGVTTPFTISDVTLAPLSSSSVFYPEIYGVVMDARLLTDASMSSSVNPTHLTSATAVFTSAVVSDAIIVNGAGTAGAALRTTIATYVSATEVILSASATTTVTGARFVFGTNNTTAMQACLTAAAGSTVEIGDGNTMLGQLTVSSHTTIRGQGTARTVIYSISNANFVSTNANNISYSGMTFDTGGNRTANGAVSNINVTFTSTNRSSDVRVEDNAFIDTFGGDDTLNRQGVLMRNIDRGWILTNYFDNGMRIKCGFGGDTVEVAGNTLIHANDNAISFLDNSTTSTINYHIHHNFIIAPIGVGIVWGDDGSGSAGQTFYNITVDHNTFYGPLQDSQSFIQYRGTNIGSTFKIDNNTFYNTGSGSNTFAINLANQTGIGTDLEASQVNDNTAYGVYDKAAYRFANVTNSTFTNNSAVASGGAIVRGLLMSSVSDVTVQGGRFDSCTFGIELSDDSDPVIVKDVVVTDSVTDGIYMANVAAGTINVKFYGVTVTGSGAFGFNEASTGITASYYQWTASGNTSGNFQFNGTTSYREGQHGALFATWTTGLTATTTFYITSGFGSADTSEVKRLTILPATTVSYLSVTIGGNQPASGSLVVTLRNEQSDTSVTVTVPAGSSAGFTVTDSTHSVRGEAGDNWSFKVVNNASTASANDVAISAVMN